MPKGPRNRVELVALTAQGPISLAASGLRIPLAQDSWIALDFKHSGESALEISFAWRSTCRPYRNPPKLAVVPCAGNVIQVEFSVPGGEPLAASQVYPVQEPEDRERMREMLAVTTSGDPVGEFLLRQGPKIPVLATEFRIGPPPGGGVRLKLLAHDKTAIQIEVECPLDSIPVPGQPMTVSSLLVSPQAANLISVLVREIKGAIPIAEDNPPRGTLGRGA
jgi:hypothetical protein